MKEQDKALHEGGFNETEMNNLLDKEFKVIVIKMLTELRRMD